MGEKQQLSFKADSDIIRRFDEVLREYHEATGVKPVKQESFETAFKDYIKKLEKQIEVLKGMK
jgi:hypothetical protein